MTAIGQHSSGAPQGGVRSPRGTSLTCRGWPQEAAFRMLQNNLDPDVAERPDDLVVYGGTGRAARSWDAYHAMIRSLTTLDHDETMLVQSGKPVGILRTHEWAPRVLIANSNLVPEWGTWDEFRRLEHLGLTMYGQMTAGSWIYIGTQGILQGTYECFAAIARKRFAGSLAGTLTITAGLGGMGGAQPLAITMNDGVALCIEVDPERAARRVQTRYLDVVADNYADALRRCQEAVTARRPLSVGLVGNAADLLPRLLADGIAADIVTDQTSAHDPLAYVPNDLSLEAADELRSRKPDEYIQRSRSAMATHVEAMVGFLDAGAEVFDYGNSLRAEAALGGYDRAFDYPGFLPAYIRPLFCEGKGPFRWVALSGDPADIAATDRAVLEEFPDNEDLSRWITLAGERVAFQGLPARICWLGYGERHRLGLTVQRDGPIGRSGRPYRHRPRPSRLRLGSFAIPRDRGHGRWKRCHRRLAPSQRPGQYVVGSVVGKHPPRWRRRNRPVDPCRPGVRRRWHRSGSGEAGAGPTQRPGHRGHATRRRRLRRGHPGRRRPRSAHTHVGEDPAIVADSRCQGGRRPDVEARGSTLPQRPFRHPQLSCQPVSVISVSQLEAIHGASLEVLRDGGIDNALFRHPGGGHVASQSPVPPRPRAVNTMTVRRILSIGHPILRTKTTPVPRADISSSRIQGLIDDLIDTMRHANGAGIAANQIGETVRILTIEVNDNPRYPYKPSVPLTVAINPQLRDPG